MTTSGNGLPRSKVEDSSRSGKGSAIMLSPMIKSGGMFVCSMNPKNYQTENCILLW